MSSAQLTEASPRVPPASPLRGEPQPPEQKERGSRGGTARKIIIVLVVLAAVGGAIWKIRSNNATQATAATRMNAAADRPIPCSSRLSCRRRCRST